jgi:arylsulfatase A-like enzyme
MPRFRYWAARLPWIRPVSGSFFDSVGCAFIAAVALVLLVLAVGRADAAPTQQPDVVLVVVDDLGWNDIVAATTPVLDAAAPCARVYTQFRSCPVCSPSRMGFHFGRLPHRDGIGTALDPFDVNTIGAPVSLESTADVLNGAGYATGMFGKWHCSGAGAGPFEEAARVQGFESWRAGSPGSIVAPDSHYSWLCVDDGETRIESRYSASVITMEFAAWWGVTSGPKFAVVAYASPHAPFDEPPGGLLPSGYVVGPTNRDKYLAAVTAIDTLLFDIASTVNLATTYVVFVCDNGTPSSVADPLDPSAGFKGSLYEGGIRTPLLVWGPGVVPGVDTSLVQASDIAATVLDLCGVAPSADMLDSITFAPTLAGAAGKRTHSFTHFFRLLPGPAVLTDNWSVVDANSMKLVHIDDGGPIVEQLFDLTLDPDETTPITNPTVKAALDAHVAGILGTWPL